MPYDRKRDLPDQVRDNLPEQAQTIYRKAFNAAWKQYAPPDTRRGDAGLEETAHRVAWAAVGKVYAKNAQGEWVRKRD